MAPDFTPKDKLREVEREIEHRHRVYARLIKAGKMRSADAQRRIQIMSAIAEDYRRAASAEPDLFNRGLT